MAVHPSPEAEERRREALASSPHVRRTTAWGRTAAQRLANQDKPEFNRLLGWVAEMFRMPAVTDPADQRHSGRLVITELPISRYNVDIAIPAVGLIIESDEPSHNGDEAAARDRLRDTALSLLGWNVIRIRHRDYLFTERPKEQLRQELMRFSGVGPMAALGVVIPLGKVACECGCGAQIRGHKRFVRGHHLRVMPNPRGKRTQ